MQLSIRLVPVGDTTLVMVLTGELDLTTGPILAAFLDPIPQSAITHVVVAAADLWFCDLSGLDQLALTHRALQARGGHLAVAEAQPPLSRLIGLMTQHDARPPIAVHASMAAALAATDVEAYQLDTPPAPIPRHLPRVRELRRVRVPAQRPRAARPRRPEPADVPPATPVTPAIVRARALREQAAERQHALADRLNTAEEGVRRLGDALRRCGESSAALRATLQEARKAAEHPDPKPEMHIQ
ncbi:STAS domain-containing protein [Nonomuraea sp. NPDC050643]|uniref:STAS domain-containing protein n=1 Tax=Nonomuraea sp. NPDC050643 TaxID=3155660 RepID=UPI0033C4FCD1